MDAETPIDGVIRVQDERPPVGRGWTKDRSGRVMIIGGVVVVVIVFALSSLRPNRAQPEAPLARASRDMNARPITATAKDFRQTEETARDAAARPLREERLIRSEPVAQPAAQPPQDARAEDRAKLAYDSVLSSNVVVSRRPAAEQPMGTAQDVRRGANSRPASDPAAPPSLEETADAVIRASQRAGFAPQPATPGVAQVSSPVPPLSGFQSVRTPPISAAGPEHTLLEGTIIDAVLTNRLDGSTASPVNALVTNPVYSHRGDYVLIPAGSRVLGETKPVQNFGESRLAVAFHRVLFPDGSTQSLDQFKGLNQEGANGLKDQVNNHLLSTFGVSAAVGLISGLSQAVGTMGLGRGDGNNRMVVVGGNVAQNTSQATSMVMNRYLNRMPTITIREGHRTRIYITADISLPAYPDIRRTP